MENIFVEFLPPWVETGLQPAFYDKESGTVLQQTARMYARVNMLIRMFNKLSKNTKETVEDYINQFNELHDYVHDYFDNLDVQEEINNKLDAMVEAGTLQEIIAAYLNSKALFGFDNVASMKSATNLIDGSYARTLGYYTKNDGGGALYKIRTITNDDVVDDKFIIEMDDDTLIAELVKDNEVNILTIGGHGNKIGEACNYLIDKNCNIYIPKGSYTLTETIEFNRTRLQFICDGDITCDSSLDLMFNLITYRNIIKINGTLEGYKDGNNEPAPDIMHIGGYDYSANYNNIYIHNAYTFKTGFKLMPDNIKGVAWNTVTFDYVEGTYGIIFQCGDTGASYVNENKFIGGRLWSNYGITMIKGEDQTDKYNGNFFQNITIDASVQWGINLDFAWFNHFENFRLSEGLQPNGKYIICSSTASNNYFNTKGMIRPSQLQDESDVNNQRNRYDIQLNTNDGYFVASNFFVSHGNIIVPNADAWYPNLPYLNCYARTGTDYVHEPAYYIDGMVVNVGNSYQEQTIENILPSAFSREGVKEFVLQVQYRYGNTSITIKDSNGNIIVDPDQLDPGTTIGASGNHRRYLVKFCGNGNLESQTRNWIVIPCNNHVNS